MAEKIDPWGSADIESYEKLRKEFGIEDFSSYIKKLPNPPVFMRRGLVFGHRDFGKIYDAIKKKKPFVLITGLMPSGKMHIGHAMLAQQFIYYQKLGARLYIVVADIEAHNMRGKSLEELRRIAIDEYLVNYIALGLKPKNCDFYLQSDRSTDGKKSNSYYSLISISSNRTTFNEMKAIYGELSPGKITSVLAQVSDIIHPMLPDFEGKVPTFVPCGVDQDPHIRLTRDIASRLIGNKEFDIMVPGSTYHQFMPGLKGGKMSSSDPNSYIALTDTPKEAADKIMKYAFSGGGNSLEEHRKNGGNPDIDVSFQMLRYMFEPDDKVLTKLYNEYKSGKLLTGELKKITIEKVSKFLEKHHKEREKAKKMINKFL